MAGRILVLDDEENYAEMLQALLRERNYRVDMATRPERAIDQLEEIPYDLIISDYKMPVMDGADFLKKARQLYPNLPFILVSGLMNTPELVKVANMGVTLVMEKPLDTAEFLNQVARFSKPMTEDEKAASLAGGGGSGVASAHVATSYPEEPRFFSAACGASKRFMQNAWNLCQEASHLFILDPEGGDGELATKDLSAWRGDADKPVTRLSLAEFAEGGLPIVQTLLTDEERSRTLLVRLTSSEEIDLASDLLEELPEGVVGENGALVVFLLEAALPEQEFLNQVGHYGLVVPPLVRRPGDVAQYARRFARMAAERLSKGRCAEFAPEAVFALLAYDWPRNCREIQDTITAAVGAGADAPLSLESIQTAMEVPLAPIVAPEKRLGVFLQGAQSRYLKGTVHSSECALAEVARRFELEAASPQTEADLETLPLVNPDLARL